MTAVSISPSKRLRKIPQVIVTDPPATLKLEADSTTFVFAWPISVSKFLQVSTNSLLHCHTCVILEYKFKL